MLNLKQRIRGRKDRRRFDSDWNALVVEAFRALPPTRRISVILACAVVLAGLLLPNGYLLIGGCVIACLLLMSRPPIVDVDGGPVDGLFSESEYAEIEEDDRQRFAASGAGDLTYNAVLAEITRLVNGHVRVIVTSSGGDQRPISSAAGILHDAAPAAYDPDPDEHTDLAYERLFFRVGDDTDNGFFLDRTQFALGYAHAERGDDLAVVLVDDEVAMRIYAQAPAHD